jgi:integrase
MSRIRIAQQSLNPALSGWMLVNDFGVPRYWPMVWRILFGGALAESTLGAALSAVERLYVHAQEIHRANFDQVLGRADFDCLAEILGGFNVTLANRSAETGGDVSATWSAATGFVRNMLAHIAPAAPGAAAIERALVEQSLLLTALTPSARKKVTRLRALPASVVEDMLAIAEPGSPRNPFRCEKTQWRNYAILLVMLSAGLRRGEALNLLPTSIHDGFDTARRRRVMWLNVTDSGEEDTRYDQPSIKTFLSHRQVPLDDSVVAVLDTYVNRYRGSPPHPFLFGSIQGRPLSVRMLAYVFDDLSVGLSPAAVCDLRAHCSTGKITSHDLRHTCAVARLSVLRGKGMDTEEALQTLRSFFGWSKGSLMPQHYAEAYFEERLKTVFSDRFDARVELLRELTEIAALKDTVPVKPLEGDCK